MIPRRAVDAALEASSRQSIRQRDLPAHVMVYYVIALALYMQSSYREVLRCLLEGLQWLSDPSARPRVVGRPGISQARAQRTPAWWYVPDRCRPRITAPWR